MRLSGIDDIRRGLASATADDKQWQYFLKYTADLDRLRNTDTLKLIKEIQNEQSN